MMLLAIFEGMGTIGWIMIGVWAAVFFATLIIELNTADLTTVWFVVSSAITLVCAALKANPVLQVIIFIFLSAALVLATRPLTKKMMQTEIIHTNADKIIDMVGVVTKEIDENDIGEIKVNNELWRAVSNSGKIDVGEKVSVKAINGNKAIVSKLESKNNNIEIL